MEKGLMVESYRKMVLIRKFEMCASKLFAQNKLPGFLHLYVGEEAVATGVCSALEVTDYITSTHRGHGHLIAKGGDVKKMMAELFAKETGYCKGKGGSMHISDRDKGILGANGIVGAGIPIATGAAFASKYKGDGKAHSAQASIPYRQGGCELLRRRRRKPRHLPRGAQYGSSLQAARCVRVRK